MNQKTLSQFLTESAILNEKLITFGGKAYPKFGQVVILAGGAGCYPKGTEYFSGSGWTPIEEYDGGNVLQFDPATNEATMVTPDDYVKLPVDQFTTIKNRRVEFTTSHNHNHLVINEKTGRYETKRTYELVTQHNSTRRGNKCSLVTSFNYSGSGLDINDDMIRLKVAIFADGHFMPQVVGNKARVSLKKARKIERFRYLLNLNDIKYVEYTENGYVRFEFTFDSDEKEFLSYWYNADKHQLKIICDEVLQWDGSIVKRDARSTIKTFSTNSLLSRDFVQFAFSSCGFDTKIHIDNRDGRNTNYDVYVNYSTGVGISKNLRAKSTTEITPYEGVDGMMYCFTVPTGFFVVRQNGKIIVSGNSGKGFVLENLLGIQGMVFDVDAVKKMAMATEKMAARVKAETGHDMNKMDLKNPDNVSLLHDLLKDKAVKAVQNRKFAGIVTADPERKPNLIFDVTLKDMGKLQKIVADVTEMGYTKDNVHIVWVINDIEVALKQNAERDRVVPEKILLQTHEGASLTLQKLLKMDDGIKQYMDGDIWFAFNKRDVDSFSKMDKKTGGFYVKDSLYLKVKAKGKAPDQAKSLGGYIIDKIIGYTPPTDTKWGE